MTPQSQQEKCCDELVAEACCGHGRYCEKHLSHQPPTEVSQFEGWELPFEVVQIVNKKRPHVQVYHAAAEHQVKQFLSSTLSTLIKEMEGLKKLWCCPEIERHDDYCCHQTKGFNQGISAAIEVVKKMV